LKLATNLFGLLEVRTSESGAPGNSYKDGIYRRIVSRTRGLALALAPKVGEAIVGDLHYARRTAAKQVFRNSANLYPLEIWFYGNVNPALPPGFYVMFYQREGSGD